jgi:hypothetical protein
MIKLKNSMPFLIIDQLIKKIEIDLYLSINIFEYFFLNSKDFVLGLSKQISYHQQKAK